MKRGIPMQRIKCGLLVGAAFVTFAVVQRFWIARLYDRGILQSIFAPLNGIVSLMLTPGKLLAYQVFPPQDHHENYLTLALALVGVFLFYGGIAALLCGARKAPAAHRIDESSVNLSAVSDSPLPEPLVSRRQFLSATTQRAAVVTILTAGGGAFAYATLIEPRRLPITRLSHPIHNLPASLDGLSIVQIADVHHGSWIPLGYVRRVVRLVNELQPDIIVLNGDYVAGHRRYIAPVVKVLAELRARIAVLGVLGNHDWWEGVEETRHCFQKAGIPLIDNANRFLSPDRRLLSTVPDDGMCIAGVGDYWEDEVDIRAALKGAPKSMPRILLSHNPDVAEMPDLQHHDNRIDLMLSGHTHGGQVRVPFLGTPIVPSDYGQKYAQGLVQGPACKVYISRGIGMTVLPVRFGVPPEIAVHTFTRA
jgi:predicted MPP superfamily phosphohydrolase